MSRSSNNDKKPIQEIDLTGLGDPSAMAKVLELTAEEQALETQFRRTRSGRSGSKLARWPA